MDEPERGRHLVYDWGMQLILNDEELTIIKQVEQVLKGSEMVGF